VTIQKTNLSQVFEIDLELKPDSRGFFARTWCQREFEDNGLNGKLVQTSISFNARKGTLRGVHYQDVPYPEAKLVRCTRGAIYDVVVDLRRDSPTFRQWVGRTLTAENRAALYVPECCGHGFITLTDDTEVLYQISEFYQPDYSKGVRWDDRAFGIAWPGEVLVISDRDRAYPDFQ
jgi:dTDP-4-dehydrorhamnose 3,5-epimerase